MQTRKLLALTTLLCFSLLVILPTVHATSEGSVLTVYFESTYVGTWPDGSLKTEGTYWGDLGTGTYVTQIWIDKEVGNTMHFHMRHYFPLITTSERGIMDFSVYPVALVENGRVVWGAEDTYYEGLIGSNDHVEGIVTFPDGVLHAEGITHIMPNA